MTIGSDGIMIENLTCSSIEELQARSELSPDARKSLLKTQSLATVLNSIDKLKATKDECRKKKEEESVFTYLLRICEICKTIGGEHRELSKIVKDSKTPDARRLMQTFKSCHGELEKLQGELIEKYKKKSLMKAAIIPQSLRKETSPQPTNGTTSRIEMRSSGVLISPKEVVQLVSNPVEPKAALIVDFRKDKSEVIRYSKESQISVVEIPASTLADPCIFQVIVNSVPVGTRPILNKLASFDVVVMLDAGDQPDPLDANGKLIRNSPVGILFAALYEYSGNHRPKAPPLYMKGGFKFWRTTYPMFVASADGSARRFQFGHGEDGIAKAIAQLRAKSRFSVEYPDLNQNVRPPSREPSPIPPSFRPSEPSTSISRTSSTISDDHGAFTGPDADNIPYIENGMAKVVLQPPTRPSTTLPARVPSPQPLAPAPTVRLGPPKPELPPVRPPPVVDRSEKPTEHKIPEIQHPREKDVPIPAIAKPERAPPPVPNNIPATTPSVNRAPLAPVQPSARPAVDRTTKEGVERKIADFHLRVLKVYNACVQNLRTKSRPGQVQPGYTGLVNITNTCFMNSTLQALANTASLRALFSKKNFPRAVNEESKMGSGGVISAAFAALLDTMWSGQFMAVHPESFRSVFAQLVNDYLANGQQHDAAEFENVLIDALHEDTNIVSRPKAVVLPDFTGENIKVDAEKYDSIAKQFSDSPIRHIFNLQTVSPKRCTSCRSQTVVFEGMFSIALDLRNDGYQTTLEECLERYFSPEEVDVECSHCKKRQRMMRHTKMWRLPKVLVIQLKRFGEMGNNYVKKKNNVRFGKNLNVRPFLHDKADSSKSMYSLYSVTNHVGTLNSGHYYAYVKNLKTRQWLEYNDESVKPISEDSLQSDAAFVLYYTNE